MNAVIMKRENALGAPIQIKQNVIVNRTILKLNASCHLFIFLINELAQALICGSVSMQCPT